MNSLLDDILNHFGITSSSSKQLFEDKATILELPKNKDVLVEGKRNDKEYLLISGVMHRYNISEEGNIVTTGFYMPRSVITPHFARTEKGKSIFNLQSLTDVVLAEIPVEELDHLRYNNQEFYQFGQRTIESELSKTFQNEVSFRSYNAKGRLLLLRKQYPNIENYVPHNIIASYLGITNVSFSRLRSELSRK